MLEAVIPSLEEMWFRQMLLADEETMAYNHAWGGTIPFPREDWEEWYEKWVACHDGKRYYRYLKDGDNFVGEAAYHYDPDCDGYMADIIILSSFRGRGYGSRGLEILCSAARENGITALYDDMASDNTAEAMFLKQGFREVYRTKEKILLRKDLQGGKMELEKLSCSLSICRISDISRADLDTDMYFLAKTDQEISLVCRTRDVPEDALRRDDGWRGFRIRGKLDFSLIGILSEISRILAENRIGIFAVSTYNTDYILVKEEDHEKALGALLEAGYTVV